MYPLFSLFVLWSWWQEREEERKANWNKKVENSIFSVHRRGLLMLLSGCARAGGGAAAVESSSSWTWRVALWKGIHQSQSSHSTLSWHHKLHHKVFKIASLFDAYPGPTLGKSESPWIIQYWKSKIGSKLSTLLRCEHCWEPAAALSRKVWPTCHALGCPFKLDFSIQNFGIGRSEHRTIYSLRYICIALIWIWLEVCTCRILNNITSTTNNNNSTHQDQNPPTFGGIDYFFFSFP